jgi:choline dehydrogenase
MLYHGMRAARTLVQAEVDRQRGLWRVEVFPGPLFAYGRTRRWFDFFAGAMSSTYFHACGTCAMSASTGKAAADGKASKFTGVVDEEFRVHGVSKLRVADASAIPAIPSSPTQAICMLLGEACGQLLLAE